MESFDPLYVWSFGHLTLHLPKDFCKHYTLQEFFALRERYLEAEDYWPAQLLAIQHNINRSKDAQAIDPQDLMRSKRQPKQKQSLVHPDLKSKLRLFVQAHNETHRAMVAQQPTKQPKKQLRSRT